MTWPTRRVFVTGASGQLGPALIEALLARGADVTVLEHVRIGLTPARPRDPRIRYVAGFVEITAGLVEALAGVRIDTVLHLAAQVAPAAPRVFWESNIAGTWSLLEACRAVPSVQRIVVVSSSVAGTRLDPYAVSKACAEQIACAYRALGVPVAVVRLPVIAGTGRAGERMPGRLCLSPERAVAMILDAADAIEAPAPEPAA